MLKPATINELDEYSLLHILSYVTTPEKFRLRRVCRKWCTFISLLLAKERVLVLSDATRYQLRVQDDCPLDVAATRITLPRSLTHDEFGFNTIAAVINNFPALTTFEIHSIQLPITGFLLKWLSTACPSLESITVRKCGQIDESAIRVLADSFNQIKSLNLECNATYANGDEIFTHLMVGCPNLEAFRLACASGVSGRFLEYLPARVDTLELVSCPQLNDPAIGYLANGNASHSITKLSLHNVIQSSECLDYLVSKMPQLDAIKLRVTSHQLDLTSLESLHKLTCLHLNGNLNLSDTVFIRIMSGCPMMENFSASFGSHFSEHCRLSDSSLEFVHAYWPALKSLHIFQPVSYFITGRTLTSVSKLSHLQSLQLERIMCVEDHSVAQVLASCPNLTNVKLVYGHDMPSLQNETGFEGAENQCNLYSTDLNMAELNASDVPRLRPWNRVCLEEFSRTRLGYSNKMVVVLRAKFEMNTANSGDGQRLNASEGAHLVTLQASSDSQTTAALPCLLPIKRHIDLLTA